MIASVTRRETQSPLATPNALNSTSLDSFSSDRRSTRGELLRSRGLKQVVVTKVMSVTAQHVELG